MRVLSSGKIALLLVTLAVPGFAQSSGFQSSSTDAETASPQGRVPHRRVRTVPCWKQAGLTPDMVNKRWQLEDEQKTKIAVVCREPSTNPQQKHDKIQQIQVETDQAIAQLIPTKSRQAFDQCQAELEKSKPHPAGEKQLGPCGGVLPSETMPADHSQHQ